MKQRLFTRDFTLLALGQALSLAGNYALRFALSMYVLELTGSAGVFAGMLALAMAPTVLLSPLGGALADRCDRRRLMAGMDAASGLAVLLALPFFRAAGGEFFRQRHGGGGLSAPCAQRAGAFGGALRRVGERPGRGGGAGGADSGDIRP